MNNAIIKTTLVMLALLFPSISSIAYAGCSCLCVNGQSQKVCENSYDNSSLLRCPKSCPTRYAPRDLIKPHSPLVKPNKPNKPEWYRDSYKPNKPNKPNKQGKLIAPKNRFNKPFGTSICEQKHVYNKNARKYEYKVLCH